MKTRTTHLMECPGSSTCFAAVQPTMRPWKKLFLKCAIALMNADGPRWTTSLNFGLQLRLFSWALASAFRTFAACVYSRRTWMLIGRLSLLSLQNAWEQRETSLLSLNWRNRPVSGIFSWPARYGWQVSLVSASSRALFVHNNSWIRRSDRRYRGIWQ